MYSLDREEFKLFLKYNNKVERGVRHKDAYFLDDAEEKEADKKIEYNKKAMIKDSLEQLREYPKLFKGDGII